MTTPSNPFQDALGRGARKIGALVYWRGLSGVQVPRAAFRRLFEDAGLGEAVGRDPKPEACLNQAAGDATRNQPRSEPAARVELKAKHTNAVYAVLMRRDIGARVQYLEEARIAIPRDSPRPAAVVQVEADAQPDEARDRVIAEVLSGYRQILDYALTLEVSRAIVNAMELVSSLPLRTGVYFVPATRMAQVRDLQQRLAAWGIRVTVWDVADSSENAAEARQDAREAFLSKVQAMTEECRTFVAESGEAASTTSINARVRRFKELDAQVALYSEILGDYRDEMVTAVTAAREEFLGWLGCGEADAAA